MKFWIGITDNQWFKFLANLGPDEVNFWQPKGKSVFRALNPGELFLFKLHSPYKFIVGGGIFVRHSIIPISLAWEAFGEKNGAANVSEFRSKIIHYRRSREIEPDPMIGCIILASPFFFERDEWIPAPADWGSGIMRGKTYDTESHIGAEIYSSVQDRIMRKEIFAEPIDEKVVAGLEDTPRYGSEYLTRPRLGQGAFRLVVTEAYNRRCAITGERTLPVLDASHIKPFSLSGPNQVNNGLLLRQDLHTLFDLGYITILFPHHGSNFKSRHFYLFANDLVFHIISLAHPLVTLT